MRLGLSRTEIRGEDGMNPICIGLIVAAWLYLLWVLTRAKLYFWKFLVGSLGLFLFLMVLVQPILAQPLARCVAALAGEFGKLTGAYTAYFKYGILYVGTSTGSMTLKIDFECSGIIEIMAFLCLLIFFRVYRLHEKLVVGVMGTASLILANALRITIICLALHYFGTDAYYVAHALIGRIFFYVLTVFLYFYVFTRPQVIQTKVGSFSYGHH
jgi:exosortase family protein XrtG